MIDARVKIKPIFGDIPKLSKDRFPFVLMPFEEKFVKLYETVIKPIVESKGLECRRADDYKTNKEIMRDIWGERAIDAIFSVMNSTARTEIREHGLDMIRKIRQRSH